MLNNNYTISYLFISLFLLLGFNGRSQSITADIINTAGNSTVHNELIYEWSVGEIALVETMISGTVTITNGMLQPVIPIHYITPELLVFPSNILTPNSDGKNDVWVIKEIERYPDNELIVFDRAGRIVYKTTNYQNNWSGDISGLPLSQDTYYYILTLKKGLQTTVQKGFITILN